MEMIDVPSVWIFNMKARFRWSDKTEVKVDFSEEEEYPEVK